MLEATTEYEIEKPEEKSRTDRYRKHDDRIVDRLCAAWPAHMFQFPSCVA